MKTRLLYLIILLHSSVLFSQNYFPFPEDQRSFWKEGNQVIQYYCDQKEEPDSDVSLLLFGADYLFPEVGCLDSIFDFYLDNHSFDVHSPIGYRPQVDSLIFTAGRLYAFSQNDQFIQIDAEIGEQWLLLPTEESNFDSIAWSLASLTSTIWLENEELTKNFEGLRYQNGFVVDTLKLILSERHGFLQYISFDEWWVDEPTEQTLFGWATTTQKAGFTQCFEDYFDIQVGSIFKYSSHKLEYNSYSDILRDSVISSLINEEGLYYTVFRHQKRTYYAFESDVIDSISYAYDTLDLHIPRSRYKEDFEATPGWFFQEETATINDHWGYRKIDTLWIDTNNIVQMYADKGVPFTSQTCEYNGVVDNFYMTPYRLGQGIGWINEKYSQLYYFTLLGYNTPNGSAGDYDPIEIITDVNTPTLQLEELEIYPNPLIYTSDLTVKYTLSYNSFIQLTLFDITGKPIFIENSEWVQGENLHNINIPYLPSGIYFLNFTREGEQITKKLIVN